MHSMLQHVQRTAIAGLTDHELLDALIERRDESAFEALLRRHGPMVLSVCQRVLRNVHDAEDAFQATFLLLVRKAVTVRNRAVVGSWLYGVAYRTALKARTLKAQRRLKEQEAAARPRPQPVAHESILDDVLSRLPEKYRVPVVLCELEGRSRKEVARLLSIPEGTLSSRLAAARKTLARRLSQNHLTNARGIPALATVSPLLLAATARAAQQALAGGTIANAVSANVSILAEEVSRTIFLGKLKLLAAALVLVGALGAITGRSTYLALVEGPTALAQESKQPSSGIVHQDSPEVQAARVKLEQAKANLEAAKAQLALAETHYAASVQEANRFRENDRASSKAFTALAAHFKYRIPFEIGFTQTNGGRIEILEVWGTRPKIEVGGQYLVRGKYDLPAKEIGTLYFYETSTGDWSNTGPTLDLQFTPVPKGQGEFTLLHSMGGPGYFHLQLIAPDKGSDVVFANVYFGTGNTVFRNK